MPQLELSPAYGHRNEIVTLFTEYTEMLMKQDAVVRHEISCYNDSPAETTIFMQYDLKRERRTIS